MGTKLGKVCDISFYLDMACTHIHAITLYHTHVFVKIRFSVLVYTGLIHPNALINLLGS